MHPRASKSPVTPEIIIKIYDMVLVHRRVEVRELAEITCISNERVHCILHNELHMEKLSHIPPDLAYSDYYLFPKLKIFLAGQKFRLNEQVIQEINKYFEVLEESYFREGITNLK
ncbi:PREDICTED: uncharacterized protein LOC106740580 [Dinoponera quadriceps]|uniref:Uncharacterized protein LOC106740580 n=1 Tax=Dinoponera quadriceps TaxID=609295 RepID=A0A6P3WNC0_DINQU|nr:PREDICTED: uncharacterized protein LOC106740580 [Dinoponera quadriceps]